jgi:viroplasmin and RNaseH domain-containing protein
MRRAAAGNATVRARAPTKYYAVRRGRQTGIFGSWSVCEPLVSGFPGARYKSFSAREHAEAFVAGVSPPRLSRRTSRARSPGPASSKLATQRQSTASALAEMPHGSLLLYTDGGCTGNVGVATTVHPAGWGVVVLEKRAASGGGEDLRQLTELHGPVELNRSSPWFLGAEVASNNTGELSGIAHALIWLRDDGGQVPAAIVYDSDYAAKITQGVYKAHKNREIAASCRRLCAAERQRRAGGVIFVHVKGHSNDKWNDRADAMVQIGKLGQRVSDLGVLGPSLSPRSLKRERRGDGDAQRTGRKVGAAKRQRAAGMGLEQIDLT